MDSLWPGGPTASRTAGFISFILCSLEHVGRFGFTPLMTVVGTLRYIKSNEMAHCSQWMDTGHRSNPDNIYSAVSSGLQVWGDLFQAKELFHFTQFSVFDTDHFTVSDQLFQIFVLKEAFSQLIINLKQLKRFILILRVKFVEIFKLKR